MSEDHNDDKLSVQPKKTLSLRGSGISQGTVKQNFSHGRTKAVVVETRKRRINKPGEAPRTADPVEAPAAAKPVVTTPPVQDNFPSNLSKSEIEARKRALEEATARQSQEQHKAAEEAAARAELDARRKADRDEQKRREEELARKEAEARIAAERETAAAASAAQVKADPDSIKKPSREEPKVKELKPFERKKVEEPEKITRPKVEDDRRRTKLTLVNALDDSGSRGPSLAALRRRRH